MSFKREGDDISLLNNLKRRRVSELLVSHIPEDEALLLKNGRYCCTVCHHRPIFDTLEMLSLHRKGNKHLTNLTKYIAKEQELKLLEAKKNQELYLKTGDVNLTRAEVQLPPSFGLEMGAVAPKNIITNREKSSNCSLLKYGPYRRKVKIDIPKNTKLIQDTSEAKPRSANSLVRCYIKNLPRKKNFVKIVEKARISSLGPSDKSIEDNSSEERQKKNKDPDRKKSAENITVDKEQQQKIEYYLNARASGWKKDQSGQWVKEEGVEFDSDEEPPDDFPS